MGSQSVLRNFILFGLLASGQLQIPVVEIDNYMDDEILHLLELITTLQNFMGFYCGITYTGNIDLRPSLERRLMDTFSFPVYTVRSDMGPVKHHYQKAENLVVVLFKGLDDPTLSALNDTELTHGQELFILVHASSADDENRFEVDSIRKLFSFFWKLSFDRTLLIVRGKTKMELWSYYFLGELYVVKLQGSDLFLENIRKNNYRFLVHVVDDPPNIFWYNSSELADVTGGGNISMSGPIGLMMIEFMRQLNVTMDIIPVPGQQTSKYEVFQQPRERRVDVVANMVINDNLTYSPIVAEFQLCVAVPNRRSIPLRRFMDKVISPEVHLLFFLSSICVIVVKFFSHRRRSILNPFFNTFRFFLALPLPSGRLDRLPMSDKLLEVYTFFIVGLFVSANISVLSTILTTGLWEPEITNVETMRASGLKILTDDPTVPPAFNDDILPSSLADQVQLVDQQTLFHLLTTLNDSFAYVVKTPNWRSFRLYQQRMEREALTIAGEELCSTMQPMRMPINPKSPIRFLFKDFFTRAFEAGLYQKWVKLGFKKFREIKGLEKLPVDNKINWIPLPLETYVFAIRTYLGLMAASTVVFIIELLYKRYELYKERLAI
ncbi:uncharacterized protein LOC108111941 [Drosophila eugracilis]|uniref:uncharacterized protein LOC108111941 n=1 Tax=Drosophila eugracilis TaxID=29029 RepID=UPI0007E7BA9E|nr:uncharacterized protein LOC108111941 [Drosophila eugracilis]